MPEHIEQRYDLSSIDAASMRCGPTHQILVEHRGQTFIIRRNTRILYVIADVDSAVVGRVVVENDNFRSDCEGFGALWSTFEKATLDVFDQYRTLTLEPNAVTFDMPVGREERRRWLNHSHIIYVHRCKRKTNRIKVTMGDETIGVVNLLGTGPGVSYRSACARGTTSLGTSPTLSLTRTIERIIRLEFARRSAQAAQPVERERKAAAGISMNMPCGRKNARRVPRMTSRDSPVHEEAFYVYRRKKHPDELIVTTARNKLGIIKNENLSGYVSYPDPSFQRNPMSARRMTEAVDDLIHVYLHWKNTQH